MGDYRPAILGLGIALPIIAIATYILRIYVQRITKVSLAADDFLIGIALVLAIAFAVDIIIDSRLGRLGAHEPKTSTGLPAFDQSFIDFEKSDLAAQLIWLPCVGITKVGILLFYKRVFIGRAFAKLVWGMVAFCTIFAVVFFIAHILTCTPIEKNWNPLLPGTCVDTKALYTTGCVIDVLTDVLIFTLPIYNVWLLQMPMSRKLGVTSIFLLGAFVVASGIVRLVFVVEAFSGLTSKAGTDIIYLFAPAIYWTQVETSLGVVSANLPILRPVLKSRPIQSVIRSARSALSLRSKGSTNNTPTAYNEGDSERQASAPKHNDISLADLQSRYINGSLPKDAFVFGVEADKTSRQRVPANAIWVERSVHQE